VTQNYFLSPNRLTASTIGRDKPMPLLPDLTEEKQLWSQGYHLIAGIDEAGRGALAGPVVACALVLPLNFNPPWFSLVRDSKQLSPARREFLFNAIRDETTAIGIGITPTQDIDSLGILKATYLAMETAIHQLPFSPHFLLIDGTSLSNTTIPQRKIIRGDKVCFSIACASIIAKVTRDRIMVELHEIYPNYGLAHHKGYGTEEHLSRLRYFGPSPIHRFSFTPVKDASRIGATQR